MTKLSRRRRANTPADMPVDPRAAPGSYLKNQDGTFTRTDDAPGDQEVTAVGIPAGSAQAMIDAFAELGVDAPAHLVAAAAGQAAAPADDEDDEEEEGAATPPPQDPPLDPNAKTEA